MNCPEAREALAADEPCEGLEAHLEACPGCRDAGIRYRRAQARLRGEVVAVPRRATWIPWAAAAGLLLAAGIWTYPKGPSSVGPSRPAPESFPRELSSMEILSSRAYACAKGGTRARLLAKDRIELSEGTLFVRADRIRISTPFGEIEGRDAAFQVFCAKPRTLSLLGEAWAAAPEGEVLVESGEVRLGPLLIPPGSRFLSGKVEPVAPAVLAAALAWKDGEAAWRPLGAGAVAWPSRFVWEARLRLSAGAYLELTLPDGRAMTLGALQGLSDGQEHRVVLRWDAMPSLRVDGREVQTFPYREVREGPAGLKATGGALEVLDWRWRPLP